MAAHETTPPTLPEADGTRRVKDGLMPEPIPAVEYYDNGTVRNHGSRLGGEMHGEWEFLRKDGSLMRTGAFDRGRQIGTWRTYDRTGKLVKETEFPASG